MNLISDGSATILMAGAVAGSVIPIRFMPFLFLFASGAFYSASAPGGLPWLVVSTAVTYLISARLPSMRPTLARWAVGAAVVLLVGALVIVKLPSGSVAAPLGISYFSFRLVAYLLDVYWGRIPPAASLAGFMAFVAFFPQITSGPIQRWEDFDGQMARFNRAGYPQLVSAMRLILFGLFKKIVVANRIGMLVDPVFEAPGGSSPALLIGAAYAFPFQLYADFSGLTDIARGSSRLLGIEAPRNFNEPFLASSVQDFWTRWHMSLTSWLRDYLFKPLSLTFRRQGRAGLSLAIAINMMAIGLWHGLKWTFVVFGLLNTIYLFVPPFLNRSKGSAAQGWRRWAGAIVTFHLMMLAFVFFRADDVNGAAAILGGFLGSHGSDSGNGQVLVSVDVNATPAGLLFPLLAMFAIERFVATGYWDRWMQRPGPALIARWALYYCAVLAIIFAGVWGRPEFIYARF